MMHTAHHAIQTRLNMWVTFFATGTDCTPAGADDLEYGLDTLTDLAREGDSPELHRLADKVERMAQVHMLALDDDHAERMLQTDRYAAAMMRDDLTPAPVPSVTLEELDAVLSLH